MFWRRIFIGSESTEVRFFYIFWRHIFIGSESTEMRFFYIFLEMLEKHQNDLWQFFLDIHSLELKGDLWEVCQFFATHKSNYIIFEKLVIGLIDLLKQLDNADEGLAGDGVDWGEPPDRHLQIRPPALTGICHQHHKSLHLKRWNTICMTQI